MLCIYVWIVNTKSCIRKTNPTQIFSSQYRDSQSRSEFFFVATLKQNKRLHLIDVYKTFTVTVQQYIRSAWEALGLINMTIIPKPSSSNNLPVILSTLRNTVNRTTVRISGVHNVQSSTQHLGNGRHILFNYMLILKKKTDVTDQARTTHGETRNGCKNLEQAMFILIIKQEP
jgi:hypothetical protein